MQLLRALLSPFRYSSEHTISVSCVLSEKPFRDVVLAVFQANPGASVTFADRITLELGERAHGHRTTMHGPGQPETVSLCQEFFFNASLCNPNSKTTSSIQSRFIKRNDNSLTLDSSLWKKLDDQHNGDIVLPVPWSSAV